MRNITPGLALRLAVASLAAASVEASAVAQPVQTVLYSFQGGADGAYPYGALVADAQGALYGTTVDGGLLGCSTGLFTGSCGTVFKLTPPGTGQTAWTETILYSFAGGADGANPYANLIFDKHGALYGTTQYGGGGAGCPTGGCGTVFMLTPPAAGQTAWTETVLYSFPGSNGGIARPTSGLIFDTAQGRLYGTTGKGGTQGFGMVFELARPGTGQTAWTETVLYNFKGGSDGLNPKSGLIIDAQGALYGTTEYGGGTACVFNGAVTTGCGTVFKLTPAPAGQTPWTETVLYSFQGPPNDGSFPIASLIGDKSGALYGTTYGGGSGSGCSENSCGTVFKLTPPATGQAAWIETVLHNFTDGNDGSQPVGALVANASGALFGATLENTGESGDYGTVFRLTPPATGQTAWKQTTLYDFCSLPNCADGRYPAAGLIGGLGGGLYGTTSSGGSCKAGSGCGTVFKLQ